MARITSRSDADIFADAREHWMHVPVFHKTCECMSIRRTVTLTGSVRWPLERC